MEDIIIEIGPKQVKVINTINQVVKKSFLHYFIVGNGVIFSDDKGVAIENGKPFSMITNIEKLTDFLPIEKGWTLLLKSDSVYKHIRDNKKFLTYIKIENNQIYLPGEKEETLIGAYVELNDKMREVYQTVIERISQRSETQLSVDMIERMMKNEVVTFEEGDYKIRLTKTLIPHIRATLPIGITFMELDDPNLFETMLDITKDGVINFHVYTCIKY